jgi:hypothetical protein
MIDTTKAAQWKQFFILVLMALGLIVPLLCIGTILGNREPSIPPFTMGDVLALDGFSREFEWENRQQGAVSVGIEGHSYRIRTDDSRYVRGYNRINTYNNVILDVSVTQLSTESVNAYGVVCRASTDSDSANGYYFFISGDGAYSIRRGLQGDLDALIAWERSSHINQNGFNRLRVVCVDDYLALWINGTPVAEIHDRMFTQGRIGFAAASRDGELLDVVFSDLVVSTGNLNP